MRPIDIIESIDSVIKCSMKKSFAKDDDSKASP